MPPTSTSHLPESQNPLLLAATQPLNPSLLPLLRSTPSLASIQDSHGYSLLHAGASYSHPELLRALIHEFHVDVNLLDEDGETCLFVCEDVETARVLVEELSVDVSIRNLDGLSAREKIEGEEEWPDVAAYLGRGIAALREVGLEVALGMLDGSSGDVNGHGHVNGSGEGGESDGRLPPLPKGVTMRLGTEVEMEEGEEPDPEFRRRIEMLASKENLESEEGQRELRDLVRDAVRDVGESGDGVGGNTIKRRVG